LMIYAAVRCTKNSGDEQFFGVGNHDVVTTLE
jgi:hypothetical protein